MKTIPKIQRHPQSRTLKASVLVTSLLAGHLGALAQSDNFNDGNDNANPAWQRYNPIGTGSFGFPGGNTYRIQSAPSPDPANFGQGRAGSILPANYSDFYVATDIVDQDSALHQISGVLARTTSVGPGSTKGYLFSYDSSSPSAGLRGDMDIVILENERGASLSNISGRDRVTFEAGKQYRLVFIGLGPELNGLVYELPNPVVPLVHIRAIDTNYTGGSVGLVVANNEEPFYTGAADATFDNFVAGPAANFWFDNFNDGNDSSPLPAWSRYNPIGTGSFEFTGGNTYRIKTAPSPDPGAFGQGRAGSVKQILQEDFYLSVDIVNWDDAIHQIGGLMARINNVGPGTTTGYLFTHDRGNPTSSTSGDMDIVRLDSEQATSLPTTGSDSLHFEPGKQYRLVFTGKGNQFTGRVYELPNVDSPVLEISATDDTYTAGAPGLVVAANNGPFFDGPGDMTFDNFLALPTEPRLTHTVAGGKLELSWPYVPMFLESAESIDAAVWTRVTTGIVAGGGKYTYSTPLTGGARYFRLAP